ncbi:MAG: DMT family transporter [Hyphomicrobiales bacterium]
MEPNSARLRAYMALAVMPLLFSSNLIIGRVAIASVEPWTLAFFRWLLAFLILLPFAFAGLRKHAATLRGEWRMIALLAFLGMWICGALVYLALTTTTATNATLIYTSSPVFIVLIERFFRGRDISPLQAIGITIAVIGVVTIVLKGDLAAIIHLQLNQGDLLIGFAAISWAIYSVLLKRPSFQSLPTVVLFATIAGAGAACLFPFMIAESVMTGNFPTAPASWASIGGLALVSSVLAFLAFQYGIKVVGPSATGVFMYFLPVYGVLLAVMFLGETFRSYHAAGLVLVTLGVVLATAPLGRLFRRRAAAG